MHYAFLLSMLFYYATPFKIVWILSATQQLHFLTFPSNLIFKTAINSPFSKCIFWLHYFIIGKCGENYIRHFTNLISCVKVCHSHFIRKKRLQNSVQVLYLAKYREGLPKAQSWSSHSIICSPLPFLSCLSLIFKSWWGMKDYIIKDFFHHIHLSFDKYSKY